MIRALVTQENVFGECAKELLGGQEASLLTLGWRGRGAANVNL